MSVTHGNMPVEEAISAVVTTAVRLILEKAKNGEVWIEVEHDGSYTVDAPTDAAQREGRG